MSLDCVLAGLALDCCIYNASGPRTGSWEALAKINSSAAGAVLAKSATLVGQNGNDLPRTWQGASASLNSEGLPNKGIDYYLQSKTVAAASSGGKPYIVSLSGKCLEDNLEMLEKASLVEGVAAIELNLACPNVIGHPIIAYDFEQMEEVLTAVQARPASRRKPLGVKLPPYFDMPHFEAAANILNRFDCVRYVASINTIGNSLAVDTDAEQPEIRPKGGFGGLSGAAAKHTALANVRKMRELLDPRIDVVGVGGISSGRDAFEMILCGAVAVQVGTCHWTEGGGCFGRIAAELCVLMKEKGYERVEDFRGKLKPWSKDRAAASRKKRKRVVAGGVGESAPSSSVVTEVQRWQAVAVALICVIAGLIAKDQGLLLGATEP